MTPATQPPAAPQHGRGGGSLLERMRLAQGLAHAGALDPHATLRDSVVANLKRLLGPEESPALPGFGLPVTGEPVERLAASPHFRRRVLDAIANYEPRVRVVDLVVRSGDAGNLLEIALTLEPRGGAESPHRLSLKALVEPGRVPRIRP